MTKISCLFCLLAIGIAPLLAQSAGTASDSNRQSTQVTHAVPADPDAAGATTSDSGEPPIVNVLTVIGGNFLGVPCLNCLLGLLVPTLGLPSPLGRILPGSNYQIDSYLVDNSYTGSCTFTSSVRDSQNNVVVSVVKTLKEKAGSEILISTPVNIPPTAGIGLGTVSTTAVCGSSTTQSKSPVFIACVTNPPYCVN